MALGIVRDGKLPRRIRELAASRPCIYGVYDNPLGGLRAEGSLCRGCMRCMVEHPEVARIEINPAYQRLGDDYLRPEQVLTLWHEATTGRVPVRGAAYDGPFKGPGFDAIWTDMSEIVRPTRDGIHGREFISTAVDLGRPPTRLLFEGLRDDVGSLDGAARDDGGELLQLPIPILLAALPAAVVGRSVQAALAEAAARTGTLCLLPPGDRLDAADAVVPTVGPGDPPPPGVRMFAIESPGGAGADPAGGAGADVARRAASGAVACVRLPFGAGIEDRVAALARGGNGCFHLFADYHGRAADGRFVGDAIRAVHDRLVAEAVRDRVTVIASGGIVMAEHVPKAILCGADAVAIDTAALVALQCSFEGDLRAPAEARIRIPDFDHVWAVQRIVNLLGAWHNQLLEVMGAMGLREARRLRGEVGRAIFADEIEAEVFGPLFGNGPRAANGGGGNPGADGGPHHG